MAFTLDQISALVDEVAKEPIPAPTPSALIHELEGSANGNVPPGGNSGATFGAGLDLGQHDVKSLQKLGLPSDIIEILKPGLGKKGVPFKAKLTPQQLDIINSNIIFDSEQKSKRDYEKAMPRVPWDQVPENVKSVLASKTHQYGTISAKAPKFWNHVLHGDWDNAANELESDKRFATRHQREASLLRQPGANSVTEVNTIAQPAAQKPTSVFSVDDISSMVDEVASKPDPHTVEGQVDMSQRGIEDAVKTIDTLDKAPVKLNTRGDSISRVDFDRLSKEGRLDDLNLSEADQNKIAGSQNLAIKNITSTIGAEQETTRNLYAAQGMSEETGVPVDTSGMPPPHMEDPIRPGFFEKAIDYTSRPISIVAGVADAAVKGHNTWGDMKDEIYQAATGRKKTFFGDVLKDAGVPELGSIDLGRSNQAKNLLSLLHAPEDMLKITGRGVIGGIADIGLDPTTWVSFGTGRALQLGNGLRLAPKGTEMFGHMVKTAVEQGVEEGAARETAEGILRSLIDSGDRTIAARGGMQFAGKTIPGTPEVAEVVRQGVRAGVKKLAGKDNLLRRSAENMAAGFDRDFMVRGFPEYIRDKQKYFNLRKADNLDIIDEAMGIFKGTTKEDRVNIFHAIDGREIDQLPDKLRSVAEQVVGSQKAMRDDEIAKGLGQFAIEDYMMRKWKNYPTLRGQMEKEFGLGMRSNMHRTFDDISVREIKNTPGLELLELSTEDAMDAFILRKLSNSRARRTSEFLGSTEKKFGETMPWITDASGAKVRRDLNWAIGRTKDERMLKIPRNVEGMDLEPTEGFSSSGGVAQGLGPEGAKTGPPAAAQTGAKISTEISASSIDKAQELADALKIPEPDAASLEAFKKLKAERRAQGYFTDPEAWAKNEAERRGVPLNQIDDTDWPGPAPRPSLHPSERLPDEAAMPDMRDIDPSYDAKLKGPPPEPLYAPAAIVEDMALINDGVSKSTLIRGFDRVQRAFKTSVTIPWPAFHVRNAVSNVANSFLDIGVQALNPWHHAEAMKIMRKGTEGRFSTKLGTTYNYETLRRAYREQGLEGAFRGRLDLIQEPGKALTGSITPRLSANPKTWRGATRAGKVGEVIENEARMHQFLAHVRRGMSFEDAAVRTKQFLFDYDNLSDFEKRYARRWIPFYTWTRKNTALQGKMLLQEPGRQSVFLKLFASAGDQEQIEHDRRANPSYMNDIAIPVGVGKDGQPLQLFTTSLPIEDLARFFPSVRGSQERTYEFFKKNVTSLLTPLARAAAEEAMGKDLYLDRPLDEINQMYSMWGEAIGKLPKPFRDFVGWKKEKNARGDDVYLMNPRALHLVRSFVVSRMYSTAGKLFDERKDWGTRSLNLLTGMRIGTVDYETQILPAFKKAAFERRDASDHQVEQQKRHMLYDDPHDVLAGKPVTANQLIGRPDGDNLPPPPTPKQAARAVPDMTKALQRGDVKARELPDIARGVSQRPIGWQ